MIRAFYSASSGLVAQSLRQDAIANNIANAQTAGYKRQRTSVQSFTQALQEQTGIRRLEKPVAYPNTDVPTAAVTVSDSLDMSAGPIVTTDNQLDFAIDGPGAFEVTTPQGTRSTRGGNFRLNANGELTAADGGIVQGRSGAIRLSEGKVTVAADGTISVNGNEVDQIKIVGAEPGQYKLLQGAYESANVNIVTEMAFMIQNMRAFEANQRIIQNVDQTLDKIINQGGRVS